MADSIAAVHEAEHELITTSLELEQLDVNLYRSESKHLFFPPGARGVFGGQVISQALLAATNSVDPGLNCHSLHCYFILSASGSIPILYYIERIRDGRTYTTRTVKAVQSGRTIFILTCSFQRPELRQPFHQQPFPLNMLPPEKCELAEDGAEKMLQRSGSRMDEKARQKIIWQIQDRKRSPITIRFARTVSSGKDDKKVLPVPNMFWMRARGLDPGFDAPFQKCILAYMTDLNFLGTVTRTLRAEGKISGTVDMMSSLDHSIWYYDHDFDCSKWLLFTMHSPRSGQGRGVVLGSVYTEEGSLVAVVAQEGVTRLNTGESRAKL